MAGPLLQVRDLKKHFALRGGFWRKTTGWIRAVDGISFDLHEGKTLALVGETGCGKSTAGRVVLRLIEATAGDVYFRGTDLRALDRGEMRRMRREMQIVFQDPFSSLNPRLSIRQTVGEPFILHGEASHRTLDDKVSALLSKVGMAPEDRFRYPHEFSGGQRQRVGIARALALRPRLIVADEPVSSLDVSIQAQVINLLIDLQEEFGLSYLFISHDLSLVEHICDTVAVMYLGKIVERGGVTDVYRSPGHPYTRALLASVPVPEPSRRRGERATLGGDVPSPVSPPEGCAFHPRCPDRMEICRREEPAPRTVGSGHVSSCHLNG